MDKRLRLLMLQKVFTLIELIVRGQLKVKKGFTLLELTVVIIIIGILATLGIQQYGPMVEKSRGAEARTIIGQIRSAAAAFYVMHGTVDGFGNTEADIGTDNDQIPGPIVTACRSSHYFYYSIGYFLPDRIVITAKRCIAGGKEPQGQKAGTLFLTADFRNGTDTWTSTYGY